MELGGWGGCGQAPGQPFAGQHRDESMTCADGSYCAEELEALQGWTLRVLLQRPLLKEQLRALALGGRGEDGSRSKSLLELALADLAEQGLVARQGYGAFAALSVPDAAVLRAEALAYREFPDEGQLPLYSGSAAAAALAGGGGAHHTCPPTRLGRLRRHSSPRQFGRMAGIEKASGGRRGKRSIAEEMGQLQLQKRARLQDGGFGGGAGGGLPGCGGSPFSGLAAMSP
ncbi:hypothetical protein ABPG75_003007 [Micractinium tetrahymenae]